MHEINDVKVIDIWFELLSKGSKTRTMMFKKDGGKKKLETK